MNNVTIGCLAADNFYASSYFHALVAFTVPAFFIVGVLYSFFWAEINTLYLLGAVAAEFLACHLLKAIMRIPRPLLGCGLGHAMPSAYAAVATFVAFYFVHLLWTRAKDLNWDPPLLYARAIALTLYWILLCAARVKLNYNTPEDVVAGVLVGILWVAGWRRVSGTAMVVAIVDRFIARQEINAHYI